MRPARFDDRSESAEAFITRKRTESLKEWSSATRAVIMGIIINSFLESIATAFLPDNSHLKIAYWAVILVFMGVLFAFVNNVLGLMKRVVLTPVIHRFRPQPINPKQTVDQEETKVLHADTPRDPEAKTTVKRIDSVQEWSTATQVIIMSIIINSLLASLANATFPADSDFKVLYWFAVIVVVAVFFTCIDMSVGLLERLLLFPLIHTVVRVQTDPKQTVSPAYYSRLVLDR